ncbi:TPA: hypothetical protein U1B09_002122 [Streptococcus suis]|nr:hypothetical protein [Streptococcus suis]MBM7136811.1 hypothetical protein [Streptococcus suis]MCG9905215.1 hypothetical protein [Streptococcus suis]MDG3098776.1 hypothetical protein [Streptococcus suis]HEL1680707.1 hypothetical protein [Streptococcus suis]HEL1680755.1 hypothetical protein [Streptococcus suis]
MTAPLGQAGLVLPQTLNTTHVFKYLLQLCLLMEALPLTALEAVIHR